MTLSTYTFSFPKASYEVTVNASDLYSARWFLLDEAMKRTGTGSILRWLFVDEGVLTTEEVVTYRDDLFASTLSTHTKMAAYIHTLQPTLIVSIQAGITLIEYKKAR